MSMSMSCELRLECDEPISQTFPSPEPAPPVDVEQVSPYVVPNQYGFSGMFWNLVDQP